MANQLWRWAGGDPYVVLSKTVRRDSRAKDSARRSPRVEYRYRRPSGGERLETDDDAVPDARMFHLEGAEPLGMIAGGPGTGLGP